MHETPPGMNGITGIITTIATSIRNSLVETRLNEVLTVLCFENEINIWTESQFLIRFRDFDRSDIPSKYIWVGKLLILVEMLKLIWEVILLMETIWQAEENSFYIVLHQK